MGEGSTKYIPIYYTMGSTWGNISFGQQRRSSTVDDGGLDFAAYISTHGLVYFNVHQWIFHTIAYSYLLADTYEKPLTDECL